MTFPESKLESLQTYDWMWNKKERIEKEHSPDDLIQCGYCGEVVYREDLDIDSDWEKMCCDCGKEEVEYLKEVHDDKDRS